MPMTAFCMAVSIDIELISPCRNAKNLPKNNPARSIAINIVKHKSARVENQVVKFDHWLAKDPKMTIAIRNTATVDTGLSILATQFGAILFSQMPRLMGISIERIERIAIGNTETGPPLSPKK